MSYIAPLKDMLFALHQLAGLDVVNTLPGCEDATVDTTEAGLEEHAKFCRNVVAPLNWPSDREPSYWHDGQVTTANGFKPAFKAFAEGGWQGVQHPVDFGGQGLPKLVATPCIEMLNAASVSNTISWPASDGGKRWLASFQHKVPSQEASRPIANIRNMKSAARGPKGISNGLPLAMFQPQVSA